MQSHDSGRPYLIANRNNGFVKHPLIAYFTLAFAITWLFFAPISLGQNGLGWLPYYLPDGAVLLMYVVASFGPLSAALIVTKMSGGHIGDLLRRVIQWRVGLIWYLVAVFTPLVIWLIAYSIPLDGLPFVLLARNAPMAAGLFSANLLVGLILPSVGEELGWRGFALPRLQSHYHPIVATLILGALHSLWHLPALAVPDLLGPLTLENFLSFTLTGMAGTFLYVWLYNHSRGSVLTAIVLHAASNSASSLLTNLFIENNVTLDALLISYRWLNVIAFGTVALILIVATRSRLSYDSTRTQMPATVKPTPVQVVA